MFFSAIRASFQKFGVTQHTQHRPYSHNTFFLQMSRIPERSRTKTSTALAVSYNLLHPGSSMSPSNNTSPFSPIMHWRHILLILEFWTPINRTCLLRSVIPCLLFFYLFYRMILRASRQACNIWQPMKINLNYNKIATVTTDATISKNKKVANHKQIHQQNSRKTNALQSKMQTHSWCIKLKAKTTTLEKQQPNH